MESVVFIFSLIDCCALIFLSVYFIITLSDLECDYINARSCCSKLNKWVVPEVIGHAVVTVLMLISLHWFIFLLNLPVATWNIYRHHLVCGELTLQRCLDDGNWMWICHKLSAVTVLREPKSPNVKCAGTLWCQVETWEYLIPQRSITEDN